MELFTYLLKVSACLALFFSFYLVVLRRLTFFKINRFYLLFALLLSFVIPNLQFTIERETVSEEQYTVPQQNLEVPHQVTQMPIQLSTIVATDEHFDWYGLLPYAYGIIVLVLLAITAWRLAQLYKYTSAKTEEINGLKIVSKTSGFTNCSFFNYVFIDQNSLTESELAVLLRHEEVHAKQYHSIDKIVMMISKAILWFNPIVYLYDKALEQEHEYEADEQTAHNFGVVLYADLLLRLAVDKTNNPLIHNFVKSPIKKRIKMLFNSKSKNMKKLMYLLALPIGLGLLWGFTVNVVNVLPQTVAPNQDEPKTKKKELSLPNKVQTNPYFKSAVYQEKMKKAESLNGKTLVGIIGADLTSVKNDVFSVNGKYFKVGKETFIITAYSKDNAGFKSLRENDEITVQVEGVGFNQKSNFMQLNAKSISKDGRVVFVKPAQEKHPFLYEVKVTNVDLDKEKKGSEIYFKNFKEKYGELSMNVIKVSEYNDNYFNSLAKQLKADGFLLTAKKSYKNDKLKGLMVTIQSNKNNSSVIWDGDIQTDQAEIVIETNSKTKEHKIRLVANKIVGIKPILISCTSLTVDAKFDISYAKNGIMGIGEDHLEAEEIVWDKRNETITAKMAKLLAHNGDIITAQSIRFDLNKSVYHFSAGKIEVQKKIGIQEKQSSLYKLMSGLTYTAKDSVITSEKDGTKTLYGIAKVKIDNTTLTGNKIQFNKYSNLITAHDATISDDDEKLIVSAKIIDFDVVTKKYYTRK